MLEELFEKVANRKFCVDTRKLKSGEVYCALPGVRVHGENFVKEAFEKGASYVLASPSCSFKNEKMITVNDVLETLHALAREFFHKRRPRHVIAITGSLGKTTTKEFLATLLESTFSVFKTPGNANSQIGLPLAILNEFQGEEVAILEMGMTHAGQIEQLIAIAPPDYALITKVALVHAVNFGSLEEIVQAKTEIFLHPQTKVGFHPSELTVKDRGTCRKKTFCPKNLEGLPFNEPHLIHNLAAALCIVNELGIEVKEHLSQLKLPERRMERVEKRGVLFINDSYNAAPESVIAALKSLPPTFGKKIAVLGGMEELGQFSESCHRRVAEEALDLADHLICYGNLCTPMAEVWKCRGKPYHHFYDRDAIAACLAALALPGDVVLLKGSNSMKMWTILDKA